MPRLDDVAVACWIRIRLLRLLYWLFAPEPLLAGFPSAVFGKLAARYSMIVLNSSSVPFAPLSAILLTICSQPSFVSRWPTTISGA